MSQSVGSVPLLEIFRSDLEFAEGDGSVVALDKDGVLGGEVFALSGAGGAVDGDVFLNEFSIQVD